MESKIQSEHVILVDEQDQSIGVAEKMAAHCQGLRHRAFSVMIYRRQGKQWQWLLQQRFLGKYHCGGLWTNTVCSHPRPNESTEAAAIRRLKEEMGFTLTLSYCGKFHYLSDFSNGLTENEIDHVFCADYQNQAIKPNPNEVQAYRWVADSDLKKALRANPEDFTPWLSGVLGVLASTLPMM